MLNTEDGTCKQDADCYCTAEQLDAYADQYGRTMWADLTDTVKEVFARKATQFVDSYERRFTGGRRTAEQALAWPRVGATISGMATLDDVIPRQVQHATCEAACLLAENEELYPSTEQQVKVEMVDVIKTEFYESTSSSTVPSVDGILMPVLKPSGLCSILIRMG